MSPSVCWHFWRAAFFPSTTSRRRRSRIVNERRQRGRPVNDLDAQIAAIASAHAMTLATRDLAGFQGTGVVLVDPWTA